ncbi:hypothetical protein Q7P37_000628 [Cladosporium fusiforme]
MAQPVLVRSYTSPKPTPSGSPSGRSHVLPPIAAFSFADILRAADSAEFQSAIDGIAEICARNHMSLAEEYGSHLPPVGEITASSTEPNNTRQMYGRSNVRRALTSVPEASSGSSEGSAKSKRRGIFGFGAKQEVKNSAIRTIRISSTGRIIPICGTTAMSVDSLDSDAIPLRQQCVAPEPVQFLPQTPGTAISRLQQLMATHT